MRTIFTEGTKLIDLPQWPDAAWTWFSNKPESFDSSLWGLVAATYRVINMTAEGLASIPFALVKKQGGNNAGEVEGEDDEDFDSSDDWQNKLGWMPDPKELLRLWRMSLFMSNTASGFMERGKGKQNLRYIVADTIEPVKPARTCVSRASWRRRCRFSPAFGKRRSLPSPLPR